MFRLYRPVAIALALVALTASPIWAANAAWGKIRSVNQDKNQFVILGEGDKERTFTLTDGAKLNCDGKECKLTDLKMDHPVVVLYVTLSGNMYACDVCSQPKGITQVMKGKIKTSEFGKGFLLTADTGKDSPFTLTDHYHINPELKGGLTKTLKEGTEVVVHYVTINKGLYAYCVEPAKK